jgi:RNA polymerase sigma factor (sigma-70 family)
MNLFPRLAPAPAPEAGARMRASNEPGINPGTVANTADDDDALMRAFAAGVAGAFERLYARHEKPLYRFVRRLLGQAAATQADEVFQDTWLRAIQAREQWQPQGARFRTWLFTIAHHRAIDCLRKSGREVQSFADLGDEEAEPWQPDGDGAGALAPWQGWPSATAPAEDQAFWRAAGQRLLDCLEGLPLPQKTAFLLHHDDGLAVDELARALEIGFETAKTRLRYATGKLRTCMGAFLPQGGAL